MGSLQILDLRKTRGLASLDRVVRRSAFDPDVEKSTARILATIRDGGDAALIRAIRRYDGARLSIDRLRVADDEFAAAAIAVPPSLRRAIRTAHRNVREFARMERSRNWTRRTAAGVRLGERFVPYDRVGVYIPGGTAPLVSSVLMTATFARVAGVPEIVAVTRARADGSIDPGILFALKTVGCGEVYRAGGAHAIAALAFGTATIRPVQKIAGPGGPFPTSAKRQVYGYVDVDLVAGPSEILVLADSTANAAEVAADLLSQAEHGSGMEQCFLVTTSMRLARAVARAIERQAPGRSRREMIEKVLARFAHAIVVESMPRAIEIANRIAPEHLEVITRDARRVADRITAAGAVFVGATTPEPIGDYVAGPSHVLPTGGAAARFSGLSCRTFQRRISRIEYTEAALRRDGPAAIELALAEGLDGHAESVRLRIDPAAPRRAGSRGAGS